MTDVDQARALDKALNAASDPVEMARLITRRRLIRAGMDFSKAIELIELDHRIRPAAAEAFRRA